MDGIQWRTRTGDPWRNVPEGYGPWDWVCDLFRRWQRDGTWAAILTQLQTEADTNGLFTWDVSVDSAVCRAISTPPKRRKGDLTGLDPVDRGKYGSKVQPDH